MKTQKTITITLTFEQYKTISEATKTYAVDAENSYPSKSENAWKAAEDLDAMAVAAGYFSEQPNQ